MKSKNSNNDVFAAIDRDVRTEAYRALLAATEKGGHPTRDQLYKCAVNQLTGRAVVGIRKHLAFCRKCAQEVAAIMRIEAETEEELSARTGEEPLFSEIADPTLPGSFLSRGQENMAWLIEETGRALTASTPVVSQKKTFDARFGKIELTCTWGKEWDDNVFVRIAWNAAAESEELYEMQLSNPLTGKILAVISSETIRKGAFKQFSASQLGLNPFQEQLAIALVFPESAQ